MTLAACSTKNSSESEIQTDSATVARGHAIFNQTCAACHTIDQDAIGPALGGVTEQVSPEWLATFIRDPKTVIESGDARAKTLFERYKTIMPSFAYYNKEEIDGIIAYLHTQ